MSFNAPLLGVINSADLISIDGYELEKTDCAPADRRNIWVQLTNGECTELEFAQQIVSVNDNGDFSATTTDGETVNGSALVISALTESDLIPCANNEPSGNMTIDEAGDYSFTQKIFPEDQYPDRQDKPRTSKGFELRVNDTVNADGKLQVCLTDAKGKTTSVTTSLRPTFGTDAMLPVMHIANGEDNAVLDVTPGRMGFVIGFPDNYVFTDLSRGNPVTPPLYLISKKVEKDLIE